MLKEAESDGGKLESRSGLTSDSAFRRRRCGGHATRPPPITFDPCFYVTAWICDELDSRLLYSKPTMLKADNLTQDIKLSHV